MSEVTIDSVASIIHYDKDAGKFTWKNRSDLDSFKSYRSMMVWNGRYAGKQTGYRRKDGYLEIRIHNKLILAHRLAWLMVHGEWPEEQIDHINHNREDNRIINLRAVSHRQNGMNTSLSASNTSGYCGVSFDRRNNRWRAYAGMHGKYIHLGYFNDPKDAALARAKFNSGKFHENHGVQNADISTRG